MKNFDTKSEAEIIKYFKDKREERKILISKIRSLLQTTEVNPRCN